MAGHLLQHVTQSRATHAFSAGTSALPLRAIRAGGTNRRWEFDGPSSVNQCRLGHNIGRGGVVRFQDSIRSPQEYAEAAFDWHS